MITCPDIVIPISYNACPNDKSFNNCPLRSEYLAKGKSVFAYSEDTLYLTKDKQNSWEEICNDIKQMNEICTNCQMANKQNSK